MSPIRFAFFLVLFATPTLGTDREDFYTSISGMENLLELEYALLDNLKDYLAQELAKHQRINLLLEDFENENAKALNNSEVYLSSPINVFKLIKRSVVDFHDMENYIIERSNEEEYERNVTRIEAAFVSHSNVPQDDDLEGAAIGFERLQQTYKLKTADLAEGTIWGVKYSDAMSASDSYYLGKQLYIAKKYERSLEWFSDAWEKLKNQSADEWDFIDKKILLEDFSAAAYNAGQFQMAINLTKEYLLFDPNNSYALADLKAVEMDSFMERNRPKRNRLLVKNDKPSATELYEATCRGELRRTPTEDRPLRCMYVDNSLPFLKIAPFKMEQLSLEPLIVYYHDVVYDNEIDQVRQVAAPNIYRSRVGLKENAQVSKIRTSKNTWLEFREHPFLANIKQRLLDMTQLSLDTAEHLQVANYGIGGHYGPHYDFFVTSSVNSFPVGRGNRIATALFYISHVDLGGATAFPYLKLAVQPVARSLVFWYNLHSSTDPDYRMMHAACPVLKGSKWILNEWLHERGQEFLRPCELQSTTYLSAEYAN